MGLTGKSNWGEIVDRARRRAEGPELDSLLRRRDVSSASSSPPGLVEPTARFASNSVVVGEVVHLEAVKEARRLDLLLRPRQDDCRKGAPIKQHVGLAVIKPDQG